MSSSKVVFKLLESVLITLRNYNILYEGFTKTVAVINKIMRRKLYKFRAPI